MELLNYHAGIIEWFSNATVPENFLTYRMLLLFVVMFGASTWFASLTTKKLRNKEYELENTIKKLDRQHERDIEQIEALTAQVHELTSETDHDKSLKAP